MAKACTFYCCLREWFYIRPTYMVFCIDYFYYFWSECPYGKYSWISCTELLIWLVPSKWKYHYSIIFKYWCDNNIVPLIFTVYELICFRWASQYLRVFIKIPTGERSSQSIVSTILNGNTITILLCQKLIYCLFYRVIRLCTLWLATRLTTILGHTILLYH